MSNGILIETITTFPQHIVVHRISTLCSDAVSNVTLETVLSWDIMRHYQKLFRQTHLKTRSFQTINNRINRFHQFPENISWQLAKNFHFVVSHLISDILSST